jgi:DNA excision repair protein ERCC-2
VQAVRHAYGDRFGDDNAFGYALTVPAVRQVRQAIGRVLRGPDERGVRVLVGERYLPDKPRSVASFLPAQERAEFRRLTPEYLDSQFERFWE